MDKNLIDTIRSVTGASASDIQSRIQELSVNEIYKLIDYAHEGRIEDVRKIVGELKPSSPSSDSAADTSDLPDSVGSDESSSQEAPEDAPADDQDKNEGDIEELSSADIDDVFGESANISTTGRFMKSLKDYLGDDFKAVAKQPEPVVKAEVVAAEEVLEEGVLGMAQMPSIARMLTLAGVPAPETDMEVTVEPDIDAEPEIIDMAPEGSPECNIGIPPVPDNDAVLDKIEPDVEPVSSLVPSDAHGELTSIQVCRDSFARIRSNLGNIKVSEFGEVRAMLAELMSTIDRLGNSVSGK